MQIRSFELLMWEAAKKRDEKAFLRQKNFVRFTILLEQLFPTLSIKIWKAGFI